MKFFFLCSDTKRHGNNNKKSLRNRIQVSLFINYHLWSSTGNESWVTSRCSIVVADDFNVYVGEQE